MLTIFIADIFGNSLALQKLATHISPQAFLIIDPYAGKINDFNNEQLAYEYFTNNVGLLNYAEQIQQKLLTIDEPFNLIGFSVGGSAIWLNSPSLSETKVNHVVCFYASQIRYHCELKPAITIDLILPSHELHFSVDELQEKLSLKENVTLEQSNYLHGFMNQHSINYHHQGCLQYSEKLTIKLTQQLK